MPSIEREAARRFEPFNLAEVMMTIVGSDKQFEAAYAADRLWVAADARGKPVGFAVVNVVGGNAHLDELDVLPEHGRRGIGTALVQVVHQWAARNGFAVITLTTQDFIPWNRPFYERMGYRGIDRKDLSEPLRQLLDDEIKRGLPSQGRIAMLRNL